MTQSTAQAGNLRALTDREMVRLEKLARETRLGDMVSFFESLPRRFVAPTPLLLGSNGAWEVLVEGLASRHRVISEIANLDEPFNPNLCLQRTIMAQWREKPIGSMQPIYRELRKGFEKLCLAQSLKGCSEVVARAHSVQKGSFRKHAPNGHVYEFDPFSARENGIQATTVGINEATTFTGFCEHHDQQIFKSIETAPFTADPKQFFLYHYRAVAHAFYSRAIKFDVIKRAHAENSKKPDIGSLRRIETSIKNVELDELEIRAHKNILDESLKAGAWDSVEGYAWMGTTVPAIYATEYFAPRKDFQGRIIQNTKGAQSLDWISLTVTALDDRALVLLCGKRGSPALAASVASIRRLPRNQRTMAIVNYIVCQLENFIMLPGWWDSLSETARKTMSQAYNSRFFPRVLPPVCQWNLSELR